MVKIGDLIRAWGAPRLYPVQRLDSSSSEHFSVTVSMHSSNKWSFRAIDIHKNYFDLGDELLLVVDICKTTHGSKWWIAFSPTHSLCFALLENEFQPVGTNGNTQDVE